MTNLVAKRWLLSLALLAGLAMAQASSSPDASASASASSMRVEPALAQLDLTATERAWLAAHPVIRIGVDPAYAPYAFIDSNGRPAGVSAEITELVAQRLGVRFELVPGLTWPEILEGARTREVDVITTASYRPEREAFLAFSSLYLPTPTVIMTRNDRARLRDPQELGGRRVALVKAYSSSKRFVEQVPGALPMYVDTPLDGLLAVSIGSAEAYVGVIGINTFLASRNGISNLTVNAGFEMANGQRYGVRKDWPALVPLLDRALASIPAEQLHAIFTRWIPVSVESLSSPSAALTAEARSWLQTLPELRVGVMRFRAPFDFLQPDGSHAGVAADTLALIRQRTGLKTRTVVASDMKELMAQLQAGDLDLVLAVNGATPALPRGQLSEPYFVSALGVFVRRGEIFLGEARDLFYRSVAVRENGYGADILAWYPHITQRPHETLLGAAQDLLNGDADFLVAETTSALRAFDDAGLAGLVYAGPLDAQPVRLHVAISPRLPELRPLLNAAISSITQEESALIRQRWVGAVVETGFAPRQVLSWGLALAALVSLGYLAFYVYNRTLRREIRLRTEIAASLARTQIERDEAEHRFRHMVDSSPNALVLVDADGRIAQVTASVEELFGYAREDLIGQPVDMLVPLVDRDRHPALRAAYLSGAQPPRCMADGRELFAQHRDGRAVPVDVRLSPIQFADGHFVIATIVDNTQRYLAEAHLRESEERFRDLFENASDLVQVVDAESGRFLFVNRSWCETLGYTVGEALNLVVPDLLGEADRVYRNKLRTRIFRGEDVGLIETVYRTKDGRRVEIEGGVSLRKGDGSSPSTVRGIFRDVTARNRQLAELEQARHQAEAADRVKSSFLATMSHELRTPLNSVIGFTGIVLKRMAGPLTDEQELQLGKVRGSARHLLALVNDVLDISKIEAGELNVDCVPFDLHASIETVTATVQPMADKKSLAIDVQIEAGVGPVLGDARRVEQILLNLLSNAVKFTDAGSISLRVALAPPSSVQVDVVDTGIGIDAKDMAELFLPFRQIDNRLSRKHEGTGLGLAISRKLAELMDGTVRARSEPGQGSVFSLFLPLAPRQSATPNDDTATRQPDA